MRSTRAHIVMVASFTVLFATSIDVEGANGRNKPSKASSCSSLKITTGESFLAARARIIREGWTPIRVHNNDNYEYDGAEKRLIERGFLEVDSCSIDAGANCILYYSKKSSCLRIDTIGEQVNDMRVTHWAKECPSVR